MSSKVSGAYEQQLGDDHVYATDTSLRLVWVRCILPLLFLAPLTLHAQADSTFAPLDPAVLVEQVTDLQQTQTSIISKDSSAIARQDMLVSLWALGHLTAAEDSSVQRGSDTLLVWYTAGPIYKWDQVNWVGEAASRSGNRLTRQADISDAAAFERHLRNRLESYAAQGHPFARFDVSAAADSSGKVDLQVQLDPGPLVYIDSVVVKSESITQGAFLLKLTGLAPGQVYNRLKVNRASDIIAATGYLRATRKAVPVFTPKGAVLFLYAEKKKASLANGILGFQPAPDGSVSFTGQADLELRNAFSKGEVLEMHWRRLQEASQSFDLSANVPYMFGTGMGLESALSIFRQDSTFARLFFRFGVTFPLGPGASAAGYVEGRRSTDLVGLGDNVNVATRYYGLSAKAGRQDELFNPRAGYWFNARAAAGRKQANSLEETLTAGSTQGLGELGAGGYIGFGKRWVLVPSIHGGGLIAETLYPSELWILGGLKTWRGFDEGLLRASAFARGSGEMRFLLDEGSHLLAFADYGWYEGRSTSGYSTDRPLGIGAGLRFSTGTGQFSLLYGLGKLMNGGFELTAGKVHFGFVSYF